MTIHFLNISKEPTYRGLSTVSRDRLDGAVKQRHVGLIAQLSTDPKTAIVEILYELLYIYIKPLSFGSIMKKSILEIYALAVCFLLVICFAITLGVGIYDVLKINHPSFTLSTWEYNKFQSNDNFCSNSGTASTQNQCSNQSENAITNKREAAYAISLKGEQRDGLQSLVNCLIVLFINIVIFVPHWIIARKARG